MGEVKFEGTSAEVLIAIDCQWDFVHPTGTMYVEGGYTMVDNIIKYIRENNPIMTVFSRDWHPSNHCSFQEHGGEWDTHCVADTDGAQIPKALFESADNTIVINKGNLVKVEEYSAFNKVTENADGTYTVTPQTDLLEVLRNFDLVVCGVAGDYCVLESLKSINNYFGGEKPIKLYRDGIVSIDGGKTLESYVEENSNITWI